MPLFTAQSDTTSSFVLYTFYRKEIRKGTVSLIVWPLSETVPPHKAVHKVLYTENIMIVQFFQFVNKFFDLNSFDLSRPVSSDELEALMEASKNMDYYPSHIYFSNSSGRYKSCSYSKLRYFQSYPRNFTVFKDGKVIDETVSVPVFYCPGCKHYHAFLPSCFFVPYLTCSIFFVLMVLVDRFDNNMKITDIALKYSISERTVLRWCARYKKYLLLYRHVRNMKYSSMITELKESFIHFQDTFMTAFLTPFFMDNRILFNKLLFHKKDPSTIK